MFKKQLLLLLGLFVSAFLFAQKDAFKVGSYQVQIIQVANQRYGYDIYKDSKLLVHQESRPYMNVKKGFVDQDNAKKMATFQVAVLDNKQDKKLLLSVDNAKKLGVTSADLKP